MTAYAQRLAVAAHSIEAPALRAGSALLRTLGAGLKRIQYGQMVSVLNQFPDSYLSANGMHRRDIPEHARRAIYGD